MTGRLLAAAALVAIAGLAAYWVSTSSAAPKPLIEVALVAVGGVVLAASVMGRLTPEIARSWRPELGILLLVGGVAGAVALTSNGMPVAAAGALMAGAGPLIVTLRTARLLGSKRQG